jgi:hypothetical protein
MHDSYPSVFKTNARVKYNTNKVLQLPIYPDRRYPTFITSAKSRDHAPHPVSLLWSKLQSQLTDFICGDFHISQYHPGSDFQTYKNDILVMCLLVCSPQLYNSPLLLPLPARIPICPCTQVGFLLLLDTSQLILVIACGVGVHEQELKRYRV